MILITGGLGFVGANTARALLDVGEDCLLTRRNSAHVPEFLKDRLGKRIFIELVDVFDAGALAALGKQYPITGIVHLVTGGMPAGTDALALVEDIRATLAGIAAVFHAGQAWGVRRITIAGAPVIYNGAGELPWREDQPLPLTAMFPMEAAKKCAEIVSSFLSQRTQVEAIEMRLPAMYGPNYDASRGSLVGRLVHAAVKGTAPNLEGMRGSVYAADGGDQCYIKDAARAIALLQTAGALRHRVYNIASGAPTTNQAVVDAIRKVVPGFDVALPAGHMPGFPDSLPYQDITRLSEDTGFAPQFDIDSGVADYIAWLKAGNER